MSISSANRSMLAKLFGLPEDWTDDELRRRFFELPLSLRRAVAIQGFGMSVAEADALCAGGGAAVSQREPALHSLLAPLAPPDGAVAARQCVGCAASIADHAGLCDRCGTEHPQRGEER